MKKGSLHFLGRKNQSLFDTKIKINQEEIDNKPVELLLDSSAIPESGTAKVRSRPTVRHFAPSSDIVQGFAVPTPTVPILPSSNGPKINGAVNGDQLSNGSAISDLMEEEMIIPPHPSVAPPPPPSQFIPPPPDFLGFLDAPGLAALHPPSMAPPKPPSLAPSEEEEEDLAFLRPPPMAPPKPPSTSSSTSTSSLPISTPPPTFAQEVSECPQFIPPQPPQKTQKTPPQKPTRLSSIVSLDERPQAPPLPQASTPSSFNPQNTAKLYSVPKSSILGDKVNREKRPQQILVLQDSGSADSVAVPVRVDGNAKPPARRTDSGSVTEKDLQDLKENLQATLPVRPATPRTKEETVLIAALQEVDKPTPTPPKGSPNLQRASPVDQVKLEESPGLKFSPLLDRKLRHLKAGEVAAAREGVPASPLALLMAAKEREKHRSSLSRENSARSEQQSAASIQPSESSPNSFTVIPRSTSSSSLASQDRPQERPAASAIPIEPAVRVRTPEPARPTENPVPPTSSPERGPSPIVCVRDEENGEDLCMPLLPPPPEFANFDDEVAESPPSSPAPDPPSKAPPPPPPPPATPVKAPPPPPLTKPKPPSPPKLPPPVVEVKPKLPVQTRPKPPPPPAQPALSSLSASQATLLSILQRKMLEMDGRMSVPAREPEAGSDDWGSPLSEETKVPVAPRATPSFTLKTKGSPPPTQTPGLDMKELEDKVAKKALDLSSKATGGDGPHSKQPGMTFIVRPGTKTPITLVSKGDSS